MLLEWIYNLTMAQDWVFRGWVCRLVCLTKEKKAIGNESEVSSALKNKSRLAAFIVSAHRLLGFTRFGG